MSAVLCRAFWRLFLPSRCILCGTLPRLNFFRGAAPIGATILQCKNAGVRRISDAAGRAVRNVSWVRRSFPSLPASRYPDTVFTQASGHAGAYFAGTIPAISRDRRRLAESSALDAPTAPFPCKDARHTPFMAVYRLFKNKAFEPEAIATMTDAYADVCRALGLPDGDYPQTNVVAKKIIEFAQRGERDPARLRECVLQALQR